MRLAGAVAAVLLALAGGSARAADRPTTLAVYGGLGGWLDIFAGRDWYRPQQVVASLQAHGVTTLYLQTSNDTQRVPIVRPAAVATLVDAAHAAGLRVVAWYLPYLDNPSRDADRALAAIQFTTPSGGRFDGFALDIESPYVRNVAVRNARLLALARTLRASVPATYPLGAIVPSPLGLRHHPHYWPRFPFAQLAQSFDAFLPMAYFTHYTRTATGAASYARTVVALLRAATRPDVVIHLIGGLASGAPAPAFSAFVQTASACGVDGLSLYELPLTTPPEWSALARVELGLAPTQRC